jgi:hypothetical protein
VVTLGPTAQATRVILSWKLFSICSHTYLLYGGGKRLHTINIFWLTPSHNQHDKHCSHPRFHQIYIISWILIDLLEIDILCNGHWTLLLLDHLKPQWKNIWSKPRL